MTCLRANDVEMSGLGAAAPGYSSVPPPSYYPTGPAYYYAPPVPQASSPYYQTPPPSGPVAENQGGKWKWEGGKGGEFDVFGRQYGSPVVPAAPGSPGGTSAAVAIAVDGKWKWEGGKAGQVDSQGHVYGSPVVDPVAQAAAAAAMAKPAGVSLDDMMLWAAAGAAGIGIAWVIARRRKK